MDNWLFYQLSSYIKKHLLIDIQQNFLPRTFENFNSIISFNLQTYKTDTYPKNDCNLTDRRPNLKLYTKQNLQIHCSKEKTTVN